MLPEKARKNRKTGSKFGISEELGDGSQKEDNTGTQVVQLIILSLPYEESAGWGSWICFCRRDSRYTDKEVSKRKLVIWTGNPKRNAYERKFERGYFYNITDLVSTVFDGKTWEIIVILEKVA